MDLNYKNMSRFILTIVSTAIILLFGIFSSCSVYNYQNRFHHSFLKSYDISDSLFLDDIICYGFTVEKFSFRNVKVERDSLSKIFINSLAKLNLPIDLTSNKYTIHNKRCINGNYTKKRNIDIECLKNIVSRKNEYILLPILELSFNKSYNVNAAGSDMYLTTLISISIFIFKNDEIVYYKQMSHSERVDNESHPYSYTDFNIPIPQKHWDGLVKEAMKEYIERLE